MPSESHFEPCQPKQGVAKGGVAYCPRFLAVGILSFCRAKDFWAVFLVFGCRHLELLGPFWAVRVTELPGHIMELEGRKELVDTGKSSGTWSVPTLSPSFGRFECVPGLFWPKNGYFWP